MTCIFALTLFFACTQCSIEACLALRKIKVHELIKPTVWRLVEASNFVYLVPTGFAATWSCLVFRVPPLAARLRCSCVTDIT